MNMATTVDSTTTSKANRAPKMTRDATFVPEVGRAEEVPGRRCLELRDPLELRLP